MKTFWILLTIMIFTVTFPEEGKSMGARSSTLQGVLISIKNDSGRSISAIKILYTGGLIKIPILKDNTTHQVYVNPTSESHLELEFDDEQNRKIKVSINTYFERNYSGSLSIIIHKGDKVTWDDKIVIREKY